MKRRRSVATICRCGGRHHQGGRHTRLQFIHEIRPLLLRPPGALSAIPVRAHASGGKSRFPITLPSVAHAPIRTPRSARKVRHRASPPKPAKRTYTAASYLSQSALQIVPSGRCLSARCQPSRFGKRHVQPPSAVIAQPGLLSGVLPRNLATTTTVHAVERLRSLAAAAAHVWWPPLRGVKSLRRAKVVGAVVRIHGFVLLLVTH